jgi:hypothetical protein
MRTPFTTPEKLLLMAILIVVVAIFGSLYLGVYLVKSNIFVTPDLPSEDEDSVVTSEVKTPDIDLTQEQKLQLIKTLKTGSSILTKQDRLDVMKKTQSSAEELPALTTKQKMDVLSGL